MSNALIQSLRTNLKPKGSAKLVRLQLRNHGFVDLDFVQEAIDELERRSPQVLAGVNTLSPLEKLAVMLLSESAEQEA